MNKKGDIGLGVILVIIIIVLFLGWLVNEGWKECKVDSDCKDGQYCTSQFECKDIPVIERTSPGENIITNFGALIIGLSLIIAAIIFKWDSIFISRKKDEPKDEKKQERKWPEYIDLSKSRNAEDKGQYEDFMDKKF